MDILLTLTQSLHLVALGPCILIILHLLIFYPHKPIVLLPIGYFLVMVVSLSENLMPVLVHNYQETLLPLGFLWGENFLPALSFLLIVQFLFGEVPPKLYWLILGIPMIEVPPFIYALWVSDQVCLQAICVPSQDIYILNSIISTAVIFMLLTALLSRTALSLKHNDMVSQNRYWIIIALIITHLLFLGLDLLLIQDYVIYKSYEFAKLLIKITFIYLMLSSILRVFMEYKAKNTYHTAPLTVHEQHLAKAIIDQYEKECVYRDLRFNRTKLAELLNISEHRLSRIINQFFDKSFSELTTEYRLNEAIKRLDHSKESITEISFDTGFNSITSFNRVFKLRMGISPSEYRNRKNHDG